MRPKPRRPNPLTPLGCPVCDDPWTDSIDKWELELQFQEQDGVALHVCSTCGNRFTITEVVLYHINRLDDSES